MMVKAVVSAVSRAFTCLAPSTSQYICGKMDYFPEKKVYMFLSINLGTVTSGPIHSKAEGLIEELHAVMVK
jgi:hypothetical protein